MSCVRRDILRVGKGVDYHMNMNQDNKVNQSIKCSVKSCAYHGCDKDYCTLNEIKVGCCDSSVACCDQTQCASFHLGSHGTTCAKN